uniref:Uncharacterized protein n=1 Tax=Arundo donax TaxID=35708 RepID=A0A0A9ENL1_ARUDO
MRARTRAPPQRRSPSPLRTPLGSRCLGF